jgi:hypothetical protein
VAYLNGSKVLTTGSALTFDGTNFAIGSGNRLLVGRTSVDANNFGIQNLGSTAFSSGIQFTYAGVGASAIWVPAANSLAFGADASSGTTEQMRLTSTGLGIGTSSPTSNTRLTLQESASSSTALAMINRNSTQTWAVAVDATAVDDKILAFIDRSTDAVRMSLTNTGNLGLGVTPSAWSSVWKVIESAGASGVVLASANVNPVYLGSNWYSDGTNRYKTTGAACLHEAGAGSFKWYTAPSGTAGNAITFTQALTLNTNGALVLQGGNTSASGVGVAFPSTQVASSDANTLDDYEEGSWTPTITYETPGTLSVTYSSRAGTYTKVGNIVTLSFGIRLSGFTKGTASGGLRVGGVPFNSAFDTSIGTVGLFDSPFSSQPILLPSTGFIALLRLVNNGSWTSLDDPDSNSQYFGTVTIHV